MKKLLLIALLAGCTATVQKPPVTIDWKQVCLQSESAKAENLNIAIQTGFTMTEVCNSVCSQLSVVRCYEIGKCQ